MSIQPLQPNYRYPNVWISGATGAWGQQIISHLLSLPLPPEQIVAYCHSEYRASLLLSKFSNHPSLSVYLGDIRDAKRVYQSMPSASHIIHAAALKRIDTALYSPTEMSSVNIDGTKVVIESAIKAGAYRCFLISTDKATQPTTFYGATKLIAEQLWLSANDIEPTHTHFLSARYGNALWSTGSVLPTWTSQIYQDNKITVNSEYTTRFLLPLQLAVHHIFSLIENPLRPTYFLQPSPSMSSCSIAGLAEAFLSLYGNAQTSVILTASLTPGDKPHEQIPDPLHPDKLISSESRDYLIIDPKRIAPIISAAKESTICLQPPSNS